jgi:hypothetical protein
VAHEGESLDSIASHYNVNEQDLIDANPQVQDPNQLQEGDVVHVPHQHQHGTSSHPSTPQRLAGSFYHRIGTDGSRLHALRVLAAQSG